MKNNGQIIFRHASYFAFCYKYATKLVNKKCKYYISNIYAYYHPSYFISKTKKSTILTSLRNKE